MKETPQEIPAFDPYESYQIKSLNKRYQGETHGVRFLNGVGILHALPTDTDADEVDERIDLLTWFLNVEPELRQVVIDTSDPNSAKEWRKFPGYEIGVDDGSQRPQSAKSKARREPAEVGA